MNELDCIDCAKVLIEVKEENRKLKKENSRLMGRNGGLQRVNNNLKKEMDLIIKNHKLWKCSKCGTYSAPGHVCFKCLFDPTAKNGGRAYLEHTVK